MKKEAVHMREVEEKVKSIAKLSTLPNVAFKVMELVENPRTSVSILSQMISADHILTARVLKLANSSYYGFPRQISTLNLAIVVLGFNSLRDLVLGISIIDQFSSSILSNEFDVTQFWRHALFVGSGAKFLSKFLEYPVTGEVFVAGLLHDIGYPIMLQHFPQHFEKAYKYSINKDVSFCKAEKELFGYDHSQLGAWLAEGWNLPEKIVNAIRFHHTPEKEKVYTNLVNIIHIADLLSYSIGEGTGLKRNLEETPDSIMDKIKLFFSRNGQSINFFQDQMKREVGKVNDFLEALSYQEVNA